MHYFVKLTKITFFIGWWITERNQFQFEWIKWVTITKIEAENEAFDGKRPKGTFLYCANQIHVKIRFSQKLTFFQLGVPCFFYLLFFVNLTKFFSDLNVISRIFLNLFICAI